MITWNGEAQQEPSYAQQQAAGGQETGNTPGNSDGTAKTYPDTAANEAVQSNAGSGGSEPGGTVQAAADTGAGEPGGAGQESAAEGIGAEEPGGTVQEPATTEGTEPDGTVQEPATTEGTEPGGTVQEPVSAEGTESGGTVQEPVSAEGTEPGGIVQEPAATEAAAVNEAAMAAEPAADQTEQKEASEAAGEEALGPDENEADDEADDIEGYDYSAIQNILSRNRAEDEGAVKEEAFGGILLAGTIEFLGIHVLKAFLDSREDKVYALVPKGRYASPDRRLKNMLMYYFDDPCDELFGERIVCIDADITEAQSLEKLKRYPFRTVINCTASAVQPAASAVQTLSSAVQPAAGVQPLSSGVQPANGIAKPSSSAVQPSCGTSWRSIHVDGTANLIAFCREMGRRLIQISTVAVAGYGGDDMPERGRCLGENELYIGQRLEGEYIRTKFLAEREVLAAAADGLDAKIIRVGNVMSRYSDGEFQIQPAASSFFRRVRGYVSVGMFPESCAGEMVELSPVDATAEAILRLAGTEKRFTVYHACSSSLISMGDLIQALRDHGFDIRAVDDAEFAQAVDGAESAQAVRGNCEACGAADGRTDDSSREGAEYTVGYQNRFTGEVLRQLGYQWPENDGCYLEKSIDALDKLGFFGSYGS